MASVEVTAHMCSLDRLLQLIAIPTLTFDKNGQNHFSQMAWINKRPTTIITAQVTP